MRTLFLDESGESGSVRFEEKWNFGDKPYFALCGVLVPSDRCRDMNERITAIRSEYHIQGGEIKASKATVKKHLAEIAERLASLQKNLGCKTYLEIVDKKFSIASWITEYCIFPYYDSRAEICYSDDAVFLKQCFANYVFDSVSNELLGAYAKFFDEGSQDIDTLKELCERLIAECKNKDITDFVMETIDSFTNYQNLGLLKHHVFPLLDYYTGGQTSVSISPHMDSFNNILKRIGSLEDLKIIHDKFSCFEDALKSDLEDRWKVSSSILSFEDSKNTEFSGLQMADFWCGFMRVNIEDFLLGREISHYAEDLLQTSVNFVGTFAQQEKLFPQSCDAALRNALYKECFKGQPGCAI